MAKSEELTAGLIASSDLAARTGHPGKDIRPCIAQLIETVINKGEFPNRSESALVIATEFNRIGLDYEEANRQIEIWNSGNNPPLKISELRKAVSNGYLKSYNYGCRNPILSAFCAEESLCPFITQVKGKGKILNDLDFISFKWPKSLSNRQVLIYAVALPYLEKKRKIGRGGLICANHKQIAETCGVSPGRIGRDLMVLHLAGLIEYNVGTPRKWEGMASEIRRVFPIPRPGRDTIKKLKEFKDDEASN